MALAALSAWGALPPVFCLAPPHFLRVCSTVSHEHPVYHDSPQLLPSSEAPSNTCVCPCGLPSSTGISLEKRPPRGARRRLLPCRTDARTSPRDSSPRATTRPRSPKGQTGCGLGRTGDGGCPEREEDEGGRPARRPENGSWERAAGAGGGCAAPQGGCPRTAMSAPPPRPRFPLGPTAPGARPPAHTEPRPGEWTPSQLYVNVTTAADPANTRPAPRTRRADAPRPAGRSVRLRGRSRRSGVPTVSRRQHGGGSGRHFRTRELEGPDPGAPGARGAGARGGGRAPPRPGLSSPRACRPAARTAAASSPSG